MSFKEIKIVMNNLTFCSVYKSTNFPSSMGSFKDIPWSLQNLVNWSIKFSFTLERALEKKGMVFDVCIKLWNIKKLK